MPLTSRERFRQALAGEKPDRPPVWIMRQAGRYLPEYRELRQRYSFLELVKTPDMACEVSLQPLRRFPLDAAIVFSDILITPEALGQPYHFRDAGGIGMDYRLDSRTHIEALREPEAVREHLAYLPAALRLLRSEIGENKTLLGFAGCPWTLACYMVEGGSAKPFTRINDLRREDPPAFHTLMEKLTSAVTELCRMQFEAGVDAVQLFDSHGADCAPEDYEACSLRWNRQIISELSSHGPVIFYAKGVAQHGRALASLGATCLSLDETVDLASFREAVPGIRCLQGNLPPTLPEQPPEAVAAATRELLTRLDGRGHIINLGHGITPQARVESVETLVRTVVESGT
ncbi:MAG: uroporphyrinogen decarboxylase [Opitutales bacterium]